MIALICFIILALVLFYVYRRIVTPLQKLNQEALSIVAGESEHPIAIEGVQSVQELAQTLNTLRDCLQEYSARQQAKLAERDRIYGKRETTLLLQHHMLQKVVEDFKHPTYAMKALMVTSPLSSRALFLDAKVKGENLDLLWAEAKEEGFEGCLDLLKGSKESFPHLKVTLKENEVKYSVEEMTLPLLWSSKKKEFVVLSETFEKNDLLFFFNSHFSEQFHRDQLMQNWLGRVTRHFASEHFEAFTQLMNHELQGLRYKQGMGENLCLLCIKHL